MTGTRRLDVAVAGVLVALGQVQAWFGAVPTSRPVFAVCALLITLPLAWRRSRPLAVYLVVVLGVGLAMVAADEPGSVFNRFVVDLSLAIAAFSTGGLDRRRRGLVILLAVPLVAGAWATDPVLVAALVVVPVLIGGALAAQDRGAAMMVGETMRLEQERDALAAAAVAEERARIARELHDIATQAVTGIAVQCHAVRHRLGSAAPAIADEARRLEESARRATVEMRRLVGLLGDDVPGELSPQPGLAQIDQLVAAARASGVDVSVRVDGEAAPLGPALDLAAYRIVQEALTNVIKHAGNARADVRFLYADGALEIAIEDDGFGLSRATRVVGHGLIGMRERAMVFGGQLEAGGASGGGFAVRATLPLDRGARTA